MGDEYPHRPVLLSEAIEGLALRPGGVYADGTFGRGGHSRAILLRLGPQGRLIGFDKDPRAVAAGEKLAAEDPRFAMVRGSFAMLGQQMASRNLAGKVDGVLLDLGVSSPQLDDPARGFSFTREGPLDMRMDPDSGISAADWLADASDQDIAEVLKAFGEERHARRIARAIVAARTQAPVRTTGRLAEIVARANPSHEKGKHPATRTFQAIRIFINRELEDLEACLPQALDVLAPGGRLAVISFHSLEDRIVKRFMREQARGDVFPPGVPVTQDQLHPTLRLVGKAVYPGDEEVAANPRARSAVMRVAERLA